MVARVREVLDDRFIGRVAVPQLMDSPWMSLTGTGWYTFSSGRDHLADVIAAMLVAAGLGAVIDRSGLDVLLDAMCWGDGDGDDPAHNHRE